MERGVVPTTGPDESNLVRFFLSRQRNHNLISLLCDERQSRRSMRVGIRLSHLNMRVNTPTAAHTFINICDTHQSFTSSPLYAAMSQVYWSLTRVAEYQAYFERGVQASYATCTRVTKREATAFLATCSSKGPLQYPSHQTNKFRLICYDLEG